MKLNKLLMAASAAALTVSSAHALEIDVVTPAATVVPALELEFPQPAGNTTVLNFNVTPTTVGGEFPAGNNLLVNVALPAGTSFAAPVTAADISGNGATQDVSTVIQSGGQANDNEVLLFVSIPQNESTTELDFNFSVKLDECPAAASPLVVNINTEGGVAVENGSVASDSFVAPCRSAVDVVVFDDNAPFLAPGAPMGTLAAPLDTDTFIELPDYNSLSDDIVGFVNGTIDGTVARDINGTPVDSTDISGVTLDVVLQDTSGLSTVSLLGNTQAIVDGQLSYTFLFQDPADVAAFFDGTPDPIELTAAGGAEQIQTQQLSVANISAAFVDANANFIVAESYNGGNIDFLQREGKQFGEFDWNSGPNGSLTNSVYRVTGLDQVNDTPYTITLTNANPAAAEGTYRGVLTAASAAATNGEGVLNSIGKWGIPTMPDFVRADVVINFESSAGIDVDRLLSRSGIVTNFGDGANGDFLGFSLEGQPVNDGDQVTPGGGAPTE